MAEDSGERSDGLGKLGKIVGITPGASIGGCVLENAGDVIEIVGWDLIDNRPSDETIDKFRTQYEVMMKKARKIICGMESSAARTGGNALVAYLEGLAGTYGVVGAGASGENTVLSESVRTTHPHKKDSGFKHPYRREEV